MNGGQVRLWGFTVYNCSSLVFMLLPQVFYPGSESPVFFVANRGHHADIGGITPGWV